MRFAKTIIALGLFVALACLAQSPYHNSLTWRANQWKSAGASAPVSQGTFVAGTGSATYVATSKDGTNWVQQNLPEGLTYYGIAYGQGVFVVVGASIGAVSADGTNWVKFTQPVAAPNYVWFAGSRFFIPGGLAGGNGASSVDGTNWYAVTLPAQSGVTGPIWQGAAYGNGLFAMVGSASSGGSQYIARSTDGTNFTSHTYMPAVSSWQAVYFYDGRFFATGCGINQCIAVSVDGTNWDGSFGPPAISCNTGIAFRPSPMLFISGASSAVNSAYCTDGTNWINLGAFNFEVRYPFYGQSLFIAPGWSTNKVYTGVPTAFGRLDLPATTYWWGGAYKP